jgi:hypothetical protein
VNQTNGRHPDDAEDAWDVDLVQDSISFVMEYLHVTPWLEGVMKEVMEQTCEGLLMLDVPSESVTKAWSRPIQWTVRRKGEALPNGSDAQWLEPSGDERHDLERGP